MTKKSYQLLLKLSFAMAFCQLFTFNTCLSRDTPNAVPSKNGLAKDVTEAQTRVLKFPLDVAVGELLVGRVGSDPGSFMDARAVGVAKGTVTVSVPADKMLLLVVSRGAFANPECLKDISATGIDVLRVSYYAMEDKDQTVCGRVLKFLPRFKDLKFLDIDRSDTTDADLAGLKELPKLIGIAAFMSGVRGECLKDLRGHNLTSLNFDRCPISEASLSYLPGLPQLTNLSLSRVRMTEPGFKQVALCKSVMDLSVANNSIVDDKSLKLLLSLRKLKCLDLRGTNVTLSGLEILKPLPLTKLLLPKKSYQAQEMAKVQALFPHAKVIAWNAGVQADDKAIFAPLR